MNQRILKWLALSLLVNACAHDGAARGSQSETSTSVSASPSSARQSEGSGSGRLEDYMLEHYVIVARSRDAVIAGRIEDMREPLSAFAAYEYPDVADTRGFSWLVQLQEQASVTASATSLPAAAAGVAAMARTCGNCHAAMDHPHQLDETTFESRVDPTTRTELQRRMGEHAWASDLLWDGLVAPSDAAWRAGASAIERIPTHQPEGQSPDPELVQALSALRDLGLRASQATNSADRAHVYGLLLTTCADCHARRGTFTF